MRPGVRAHTRSRHSLGEQQQNSVIFLGNVAWSDPSVLGHVFQASENVYPVRHINDTARSIRGGVTSVARNWMEYVICAVSGPM
jgi:hypothetical protein